MKLRPQCSVTTSRIRTIVTVACIALLLLPSPALGARSKGSGRRKRRSRPAKVSVTPDAHVSDTAPSTRGTGGDAARTPARAAAVVDESDPRFVDAPVPLLLNDTLGTKLLIQDQGLAWLEALGDTPLCIVVTAGPARSGKSFLVNNLLGADHRRGFGVGHGVQGFTRGVWFWGRPQFVDLGDKGGRVAVVHMDTEGFGALGNVAGYDPKLCLFSVLFASSFYYNLRGLIDMNNIKFLSTVAMFDDVFRSKFGIEFPLAAPFWVVQNFESDLSTIDPPTAEGYLDLALSPKSAAGGDDRDSSEVARYNQIIAMIKRKFPEQPRPRIMLMEDPKQFVKRKDMAKYKFHEYDEAYREQIKELRSIMAKRVAVKKFQNLVITASTMSELTRRLVPAMNKLDNDAPGIIRGIATVVAKQCFDGYVKDVETVSLPAPGSKLEAVHKTARSTAHKSYDDQCVGSPELEENADARELLSQNITMTHSTRRANNKLVGMRHCELLYTSWLADLNVYRDAVEGKCDMPKRPIDAAIIAATDDLRAHCHVPRAELDAKLGLFNQTASMIRTFVVERRAAQALERGSRVVAVGAVILWTAKLITWALSTVSLCPAKVHSVVSALATLSTIPLLFFILFQLGLLEQAFAACGVGVTRQDLQVVVHQALEVMERVRWAMGDSFWLVGRVMAAVAGSIAAAAAVCAARRDLVIQALAPKLGPGYEARLLLASHSLLAVAALGLLVLLARKSSRRVTVVALLAVVGVLSADRVFAVLVGTPGADGAGGPADAV